jgi:hypothetical protein
VPVAGQNIAVNFQDAINRAHQKFTVVQGIVLGEESVGDHPVFLQHLSHSQSINRPARPEQHSLKGSRNSGPPDQIANSRLESTVSTTYTELEKTAAHYHLAGVAVSIAIRLEIALPIVTYGRDKK